MICFYFIVIIGKTFEYYLCLHLVIKDMLSRNEAETRNEQVNVFTYVVIADRTDMRDNLRIFLSFDLKLHSFKIMKYEK